MPWADPEQVVARFLTGQVFTAGGADRVRVVVGDEPPSNLQHAQRVVQLVQLPSSPGDAELTLDAADIEINTFARTRDRSRDLAAEVRTAMRWRLPKSTDSTTGAFVTRVDTLGPPVETEWQSSTTHRRMASYRVWIHHNPF